MLCMCTLYLMSLSCGSVMSCISLGQTQCVAGLAVLSALLQNYGLHKNINSESESCYTRFSLDTIIQFKIQDNFQRVYSLFMTVLYSKIKTNITL